MRVRMDKGKGKEIETRNKMRRTEKMVVAQQACKSLHSQESHTEMRGGMRPWLPSVFSLIPLDKVKGGVFVLQQLLYARSK